MTADRNNIRRDSFPPQPIRLSTDAQPPPTAAAAKPTVASERGTEPPHRPLGGALGGPNDFWFRACQALVFLVLFLTPCLYPLRLSDAVIQYLRSRAGAWWQGFYVSQLDTFVNYGYSPLPLKEGAFTVLTTLLFLCWFIRQTRRARLPLGRTGDRFDWRIYGPIAALLAWGAIAMCYTPTFHWSLTTYGLMAAGLLWFIVVYQMPKPARLLRRWFNAILLAGGIVAFFAFLQDADRYRWITGQLFVDLEEAARSDVTLLRLRMGSLIGHNIGVAGFLSFSWFILLSRLSQPAPWKRKIGWAALFVLLFYVILAAQTRGVWLVLLVLTPCHLLWLVRLRKKRLAVKPILGAILLVLIILTLQAVPSRRNPFYSPESPLLVRFTHFTPSHLLTETRLRIAVCSGSLITGWPLLSGHGLGSFQYLFPTAQANYFAAHPQTLLAPSPNRTVQAHSDWLQLLIELGLPGLLIVLVGLYLMLRRGWDSWQRLTDSNLQLELTAPLMGVAAVMFHALADFPIHVVSTSATAIFLLAVWAGCGQIESPVASPAPVAAGRDSKGAKRAAQSRNAPTPSPASRLPLLASRLVLILVIPASLGAAAWFYSLLHAAMYESLGTSYRIYYGDRYNEMSDRERRYVLALAYDILKRGHKLAPLDCQIVFRVGEVATLYGVLDFLEAERIHGADDPTSKSREAALRSEAVMRLTAAVNWLQRCQTEVRYHEVFHYLGMAHEHLFRLLGVEDDRQKAKHYYRLAVRYSPCFSRSLYRLFGLLQQEAPPNVTELREVTRQIARFDPPMFQRQFTEPVMKSIERRDFKQAAAKIEVLLDVEPNRPDLWLTKIHLLVYGGRGADAQATLAEFVRTFPDYSPGLLLGYQAETAFAGGQYADAARMAEALMAAAGHEGLVPYYRCLRAAALDKLKRPEAKSEWAEIERLAATNPAYQTSAADVLFFLLGDRDRAYPFLVKCCQSETPAPASIFRLAADLSFKRGDKQQGVTFLERALELDPEDPQTQLLLKTARP